MISSDISCHLFLFRTAALPDAPEGLTADSVPYDHLLLFPEGTTTTGSTLIAFKAGAFRPAVPVQVRRNS